MITASAVNMVGFPGSIPGDAFLELTPEELVNIIPSVYQGIAVAFDITFSYSSTVPENVGSVTSVTVGNVSSATGFTFTEPNATTVHVEGTIFGKFDESHTFLLRDLTEATLPVDTLADWIALVKWQPASYNEELMNMMFTVSFTENSIPMSTVVTVGQYVYWNYEIALQQFKQLVTEGET
jgi:hypothetical protein